MKRADVVARFDGEWRTAHEVGVGRQAALGHAVAKRELDRLPLAPTDPRYLGGKGYLYRRTDAAADSGLSLERAPDSGAPAVEHGGAGGRGGTFVPPASASPTQTT